MLDKGANIKAVDDTGKTSILHLFHIRDYDQEKTIQDQKEHDKKVVEILKLLKEKDIPIDCFTVQDSNDKMTPLIRAVVANLPKSINFIIELLEDNNLLKEQVTHKDRKGSDVLDQLLYANVHSKEPCNESFTEKKLISIAPEKVINFLTKNSYTSYDIQLFYVTGELLYAASGINFKKYESGFINSLSSEKVKDKYILRLIKSSDILSSHKANYENEDILPTKNLA
ncbi:MAG: hypothetical protein ACRYE8_07010 [Janthinobacterium lividum]